jgi:uncharacterized protein YfaP (DUF2135 family)
MTTEWKTAGGRWCFILNLGLMLGLFVAGCGSGGGSSPPPATTTATSTGSNPAAVTAITQLKTPQTQQAIDFQPFPFMIRATADTLPAVQQLIALGPAALEDIFNEFRRTPTVNDDVLLSLLAYVLEKIGDKRAVPVLADWLDANLFAGLPGWPTDFVTHTIKVLQPQTGLSPTYTYLINEKVDTLLQARQSTQAGVTQGILPPQIVSQGVLDNQLTDEQKRICFKVINVTGIDAAGKEQTLQMNYKTVTRDLNDVVADPSTPQAVRDAGVKRLEAWLSADEKIYGGFPSLYVPEPGSKVTDATNCGGRVIEKVVNRLTTQLGIPINLGPGGSSADAIRQVAKTFGTEVGIADLDPLTVIAIEKDGSVSHVEFPIAFVGGNTAVIQSKWDYGLDRTHTVLLNAPVPVTTQFAASVNQTNGNPFFVGGTTVKFYKIDPTRIKRIVVDSSLCPCDPANPAGIPVQISQPTKDEVPDRVITVSGSVSPDDAQKVSVAKISVNGTQQDISLIDGSFQAQVVLRSGDNEIRVSVEGVDGRRGCAIKKITSTTPKTTISATLTWNLDKTDVDLYVTQPDKQTAWYNGKTTSAGGRLDVDNTSGFGPENYFISLAADSPLQSGTYDVRVHYYRDHQQDENTPTRPVTWKVVILLNEGTPKEKYEIYTGTISAANPDNDAPGSSGPDWATAKSVVLGGTP